MRVKTGNSPAMTSAFLSSVDRQGLELAVFRDLAKRLTALRSNVCYEVIDDSEAALIVKVEVEKSLTNVARKVQEQKMVNQLTSSTPAVSKKDKVKR